MNNLSFNNDNTNNLQPNRDVLSLFNKDPEKNMKIKQGMSVKEISEVVSEKLISVVKEQFEVIKNQFESKKEK